MPRSPSPLRYPGGKTCLSNFLSALIERNRLRGCHYVEPYAGGCGLALELLFTDQVSRITINDIDVSIWSFWKSVLDHTDELIQRIEKAELTVEHWKAQREIQLAADESDPVTLGFSTFFLNRTNRSGIISGAGVIGGMDQSGKYKMGCRFNREELIRRIRKVSEYREQIDLRRDDAVDLMNECSKLGEGLFFCIDPPYFSKGSRLYTSFYDKDDHAEVADAVRGLSVPWIVTYDNQAAIRELYDGCRQFTFDINYSIQSKRIGTELLVASEGLEIPMDMKRIRPTPIQDVA